MTIATWGDLLVKKEYKMTMPILQNRDYTLSVAGTMGRNSVVAMLGNDMVIGRLKNNTITFRITDFTEEDTIVLICPEGGSITHAQLERGNKATDWTPAPEDAQEYTENKVAEAKKYVDDLEVGGRNLIVQSTITRGKFLTVTGSESINAGWFYTDFIPVSNYKNLVTSGYSILGDSPSVVYYNSSKVFVKGINNGNLERAKNITIDSGIAFIRFSGMLVDLPTLKLEKGNKATDWTPAPEDARTYKAWANSSDGTVDFTRAYPNENLIVLGNAQDNKGITWAVGAEYTRPGGMLTDYIEVSALENITTSRATVQLALYNKNKEYLSSMPSSLLSFFIPLNGTSWTNKPSTLPTDTDPKYLRATYDGVQVSNTEAKVKLEKGTTPTIYTTNSGDSLTGSVPKYVGFSPLDSDKSSDYEWIINPEWAESSSMEHTSSSIKQTSESIMATVTESFVAEEDYTQYKKDVATEFTQTAKDFNLLFSTVSEEVKKVESGSETKFEKIEKYIRFVDGKIVLGTSDSDSVLEISNDRISFKQGGNEVAHFAGQTFTISKGILTDSMQVGDHRMTKNAGGLTTFDYIP